jgi:glutamyl-Q tRNA(Asp) synthetase
LDRPREVPGSAAEILRALEKFGFEWDASPVRQSDRQHLYEDALHRLQAGQLTFQCSCSRLQLEDEDRYPGTCRARSLAAGTPCSTRLRIEAGTVSFNDRIQGRFRQDVSAAVGDIILRRRDSIFAYVLAVVVDDAAQGVTHVVRGADLLDNTPRQIYLQRALGMERPSYAHVPVLMERDGGKLAKSRRSMRLGADSPAAHLLPVFSQLGLAPPESLQSAALAEIWSWAIGRWDIGNVPKCLSLRATD